MPGMDGTGPYGTGPVGRGLGPCGGGWAGRFSRGWGRGFGYGGWYGWNAMNMPSPVDEIALLENQKKWLESQIEVINTRIASLSKNSESE